MSQFDEFLKEVEGLTEKEIKVLVVTGKPGSGKSKVLREAAETKGWDYIDTRLLITEDFLKLLPSERRVNASEVLKMNFLAIMAMWSCWIEFRPFLSLSSISIPRASSMNWGAPLQWSLLGRDM